MCGRIAASILTLVLVACGTAPAALPTSAPPPTTIPYNSGGLGQSRAEWELMHGAPTSVPDGDTYEQQLFSASYLDGRLNHIEYYFPTPTTLAAARIKSKRLIPSDAELVKTYTTTDTNRLIDLYHSPSLAERFTTVDLWIGGKPGDFIVLYRQNYAQVTSIVLGLGNNP